MRLLIAVSSEGIHPFGSSVRLSLNRTAKDNLVWASVQGGEDLWLSSGLLSLLRQWAGDGTHDSVEGFGQGPLSLRSEEYTSELQSRGHLVCRLLLEKKKQE